MRPRGERLRARMQFNNSPKKYGLTALQIDQFWFQPNQAQAQSPVMQSQVHMFCNKPAAGRLLRTLEAVTVTQSDVVRLVTCFLS